MIYPSLTIYGIQVIRAVGAILKICASNLRNHRYKNGAENKSLPA